MLLTITTNRAPATDLGWLLHKHPAKRQSFELSFGSAHVFYPVANEGRCTAALLLDVDAVGLVRRDRGGEAFALQQYVNDRPYVASSFMSVAIAQVFGTALNGRCKDRPELVDAPLPLEVRIAVLPCRSGPQFLTDLFAPLGYEVTVDEHPLDPTFDWGPSPYFTVTLRGTARLQDLLAHLYVLIPVLDNDKHYWVGDDELEKLVRKGGDWLRSHPLRDAIARRYLKHQHGLAREAIARLSEEDHPDPDQEEFAHEQEEARLESTLAGGHGSDRRPAASSAAQTTDASPDTPAGDDQASTQNGSAFEPDVPDRPLSLNAQRLAAVHAAIRAGGARSVLDMGCGEGKLLRLLINDRGPTGSGPLLFDRIVGMDVSIRALRIARERLRLDRLPPQLLAAVEGGPPRFELIHGSLVYRDERLSGFDAAACVEVIEHLDPSRLAAFERVLFEFAKPRQVILTTPNREYNVVWESLPAGEFRHRDHRFEWTRGEFQAWCTAVAQRHGYRVRYVPIGPADEKVGPPTQMGVFTRDA